MTDKTNVTNLTYQLKANKLKDIQGKLKHETNLGDNVKSDMYAHLTEVISYIMQYHPIDGFEKFEEVSNNIKYNNYRFQNPKKDTVVNEENSNKNVSNKDALMFLQHAKKMIDE